MVRWFPILAVWLVGCASTVRVQIPASPAVSVELTSVAVLVGDKGCQDIADALVTTLRRDHGAHIDPRAPVRVLVEECGVRVHRSVDVVMTEDSDRRRLTVDGRGYAAVSVSSRVGRPAVLLGAARDLRQGGFEESSHADVSSMTRSVEGWIPVAVARDLAAQLSPVPRVRDRRVYPGADEASPRGLAHQAVLAELDGDLSRAHDLAARAYAAHPTARVLAYRDELAARLRRTGGTPNLP